MNILIRAMSCAFRWTMWWTDTPLPGSWKSRRRRGERQSLWCVSLISLSLIAGLSSAVGNTFTPAWTSIWSACLETQHSWSSWRPACTSGLISTATALLWPTRRHGARWGTLCLLQCWWKYIIFIILVFIHYVTVLIVLPLMFYLFLFNLDLLLKLDN